jgi:glycosyltransferase involved in cell wall biosynthesis
LTGSIEKTENTIIMKVLLTTDNIGGVWTFSLNLAKGLKTHGIDVSLAVIGNELTENQKKESDFVDRHFFQGKQEWMQDPWEDIEKAGYWLLDLEQELQPELIHLNSYSFGSLPWDIPVVLTAHSCVLSWWEAVKHEAAPPEWSLYRDYVMNGIRSADIVTAPSYSMLRSVEKFYGPVREGRVIRNGADASMYHSERKEDIVFCMGRLWDEGKNIRTVLSAAASIDYPVYIAGDYSGLDLADIPFNVHFTGQLPRESILSWLSRAAIYLLPVRYEPFGYSFLEAALSNCALITGNKDSMKEIWKDAASYVDPDNPSEIASRVNTLMADRYVRQLMADRAQKRATSFYSLDIMTSEFISLYRMLAEVPADTDMKYQDR